MNIFSEYLYDLRKYSKNSNKNYSNNLSSMLRSALRAEVNKKMSDRFKNLASGIGYILWKKVYIKLKN